MVPTSEKNIINTHLDTLDSTGLSEGEGDMDSQA